MGDGHAPVRSGRDAGSGLAIGQGSSESVSVIASVAEQGFGFRQCIKHQRGAFEVAHLPFAERHDQRTPVPIADSMEPGSSGTFGASDKAGNSPF